MRAWAESLGGITYPLLSDFWPHGGLAQKFGVLRAEGYSERAIFIINRSGVITYVDIHPIEDQPDNEVLFRELAALEGVPVPQEIIPTTPTPQPEPVVLEDEQPPALTMYCTDWCPACRRARIYFKQYGIAFKEVNITRDRQAAAQVRSWTGGFETTPTFDVNGTVVINFDLAKLNPLLGIQDDRPSF